MRDIILLFSLTVAVSIIIASFGINNSDIYEKLKEDGVAMVNLKGSAGSCGGVFSRSVSFSGVRDGKYVFGRVCYDTTGHLISTQYLGTNPTPTESK